jgi:FkbM family methyltransferase
MRNNANGRHAFAMNINSNLFDHTLRYLGLSGVQASFVVIGAMDGVSFDEFHSHVRTYQWSGVLVEPIPEQFRRLVSNYTAIGCSPDNRYENSAIAEHDGTILMQTIQQEAIDSGKVHECFGGMSAIYPPRNGLGSEGDAETVRRYGELIEVPCITLQTLLERHRVEAFDILCIDAEGWDFKILRQLDFSRWRPKLIRIEYINLSYEEKSAVTELLDQRRYYYRNDGINLDAVALELWDRIGNQHLPNRANPSTRPAPQNLTLVTSLLPLMLDHDSDSPSIYRRAQALLQSLNPAQRLMIYLPPGAAELAARERNTEFTFLIRRRLEDLSAQEHHGLIHEALIKSRHQSGDLKRDAMSRWLSLSAPFLLNDASLYNPFGTEHFLWVDFDVLPVLARGLDEKLPEWSCVLEQIASDPRLWLPAGAAPDREALEQATRLWLKAPLESVLFSVTGKALGGAKPAINAFNGVYYACLDRLLKGGELCSTSEVLTLVAHSHPHLCNLQRAGRLQLGSST